jgi:hypothetical protein
MEIHWNSYDFTCLAIDLLKAPHCCQADPYIRKDFAVAEAFI